MNKREQKFCTEVQKWIKHNMKFTFGWEAKVIDKTKRKSYTFASDKSFAKEMRNLKLCGSHIVHKFSDMGGLGTLFDGISIAESPGYFFFQFKGRGTKHFYIIEVSVLDNFIKAGNNKLTETDCLGMKGLRVGEIK